MEVIQGYIGFRDSGNANGNYYVRIRSPGTFSSSVGRFALSGDGVSKA